MQQSSMNVYDVFGKEASLKDHVVVIGGSAVSAVAAIYRAGAEHHVTEISRKHIVAYELNPIRERGNVNRFSCMSGVHHIRSAETLEIGKGIVYYRKKNGAIENVTCDEVIVNGGLTPRYEEAMAFFGSAPEYYAIGGCRENGSMRDTIFNAYSVSMNL